MKRDLIKCPFDEFKDMEFEVQIIFNLDQVPEKKTRVVHAILKFIRVHAGEPVVKALEYELERNLSPTQFYVYKSILNSYDEEENKFKGTFMTSDESLIFDIYDFYTIVCNLQERLSNMASYYLSLAKNNTNN